MGQVHTALLARVDTVDAITVVDVDIDRAREVARPIGATAVDDPMSAFDAVDAAVIATPPSTHARLLKVAVDARCPTLCEKPLAENVSVAAEVANYVEEAGVLVEVGFHRRFDAGFRAARAAIADGRLGKLHLIRLQSTEPGRAPSPRTNLLRNTAIHDFDLVRWLSGDEVVSVYAEGSDRERRTFDPRFDPDSIVAAMRLSSGGLAAVTVSRLSPNGYDVRAEIVGGHDQILVGMTERTPVRSVEPGFLLPRDEPWSSWQIRFENAYERELTHFLAAVAGDEACGATVRDGLEAQCIAEAAKRSLDSGTRVEFQR